MYRCWPTARSGSPCRASSPRIVSTRSRCARAGGSGVADRRPRASLGRLDLAVLGGCAGREVVEEVLRGVRDRLDGLVEGLLVGQRRLRRPRHLADVLQRGGADLVAGRRRLEVVQLADIAAHASTVCRGDAGSAPTETG